MDGQLSVNEKLVRDSLSFMVMWDQHIGEHGFVEAAKALAVERRK